MHKRRLSNLGVELAVSGKNKTLTELLMPVLQDNALLAAEGNRDDLIAQVIWNAVGESAASERPFESELTLCVSASRAETFRDNPFRDFL